MRFTQMLVMDFTIMAMVMKKLTPRNVIAASDMSISTPAVSGRVDQVRVSRRARVPP
jgi:hypothetical protein